MTVVWPWYDLHGCLDWVFNIKNQPANPSLSTLVSALSPAFLTLWRWVACWKWEQRTSLWTADGLATSSMPMLPTMSVSESCANCWSPLLTRLATFWRMSRKFDALPDFFFFQNTQRAKTSNSNNNNSKFFISVCVSSLNNHLLPMARICCCCHFPPVFNWYEDDDYNRSFSSVVLILIFLAHHWGYAFSISPGVLLCGWLGLKHQLTN